MQQNRAATVSERGAAPKRNRSRTVAVLFCTAGLFAGCGYVGSPLPPLANIPTAVTDLAAVQRGSRILVHFTTPGTTTEGRLLKPPLRFDLRIGSAVTPFSTEAWASAARELPSPAMHNGLAELETPSAPWTGRDVTLAVRVIGSNGKESAWSNFVNLTVVPPPPQPAGLKAEGTAEGVRLTWQPGPAGAPGNFIVLRRAAPATDFLPLGSTDQNQYLDRTAEFDKTYTYMVQRVLDLGEGRTAQSELSEPVSVTPKDIFPPAAPRGLRAVAAPGSIELSWDANSEPDLAGYRVYRAAPGADFQKLADVGLVPAFSDHAVEAGKTYRYAITAIDRAGNESGRSAAVEAAAQ